MIGSGLKVCLVEGGGLEETPKNQALYSGYNVGRPMEMDVGRYRLFGGSTSRWAGRRAELDPIDLIEREWIPFSGWPIDFGQLDAYYDQARITCGMQEVASLRPTENADPACQDRVDQFIWQFPDRTDANSLHFGMTYHDTLRTDPDISVFLHANITGFEVDGSSQVRTIRASSLDGGTIRISARAFVLCCGGIENARILLNSAETVPGGIGNQHDLVGRFFMQHPRGDTATIGASKANVRRLQKMFNMFLTGERTQHEIGFALPERVQREERLLNASAVLSYKHQVWSGWNAGKNILDGLRARKANAMVFGDIRRVLADPLDIGVNALRRLGGNRTLHLGNPLIKVVVDLEQTPDPDSRVVLSAERDRFDWFKASVDWRIATLERRTARRLTELVAAEMTRLELGETEPESWLFGESAVHDNDLVRTYHHIGTTRMAADPRNGVVNADCRIHGTSNMYVAGCSVFPTGGHVNPTLTIVALALRLSTHLKQTLKTENAQHVGADEKQLAPA